MSILLREINKKNYESCYDLKVSKEQGDFVAHNGYSMVEAAYEDELYPLAIYNDEEMVGFLMYGTDEDDGRMYMCRLMIDFNHQKKGYGKKAVELLLLKIKKDYGDIEVYTSIEPENKVAGALYESMGFKKTGEILWEEEVLKVQL